MGKITITKGNFGRLTIKHELPQKTAQTDTKKSFGDRMQEFNAVATTAPNSSDFTTALYALATAVAYSVIKKCLDPQRKSGQLSNSGFNSSLFAVYKSIGTDYHTVTDFNTAVSGLNYKTVYDKRSTAKRVCITPDFDAVITKHVYSKTYNDGMDLIHVAIIAILSEMTKQLARDKGQSIDFERAYTKHELNKRIKIKLSDSCAYKEVETTPIQEIFRAVRRAVQNSRAIQSDPKNGYTYIEDLAVSSDSETTYYRLPKYADMGGYVKDFNGQDTSYTADLQTVTDTDTIIDSMKLTTKQSKVLELSLRGYGIKAIASYLGISHQAVAKTKKQIQVKAEKIGLTADKFAKLTAKSDG